MAVAPLFSAIFGGGSFIYGIFNGQQKLAELKKINKKLDKLQESVDELSVRVKSLQVGQEWNEGAILYANDVQRLRFILHQMHWNVVYCTSSATMVLKSPDEAKEWADAVLDNGPDGLEQVLFSLHDLVMGTGRLFGKRSLISVYKDQLAIPSVLNPGTYTQDMEDFVQYIMALESGGYAAISTAMNINGEGDKVAGFIKNIAEPRMKQQWIKISEISGVPASWRWAPQYIPPFHISADPIGDLGARFVDLNGDGKIDMVYHRWINGNTQQKGAYLNNGNGWTSAPQYIPPFHISADPIGDLGARFADLNGDGKIDMVYHRWINANTQQKGAYLNNGNGWTSAPQYTPPFHITADPIGDLGARFVDLNGDGKIDMVYHRWINANTQQKGAYLNNGNGWTSAPQYTPPFHITADPIGDLGARFADLNGDGKIDMVFHRWINANTQQKGAYLNNGNGWTSAPQYTPPFHIAADPIGDLGARFVDVNGDGKSDMVYHRWINGDTQQKGAYLNNGNGWTSAPQYTPPFHISADPIGDLGARFVDLNGDGHIDMVYHRWINGNVQQKGAYLNLDFFGDHTKSFSYASGSEQETC